MLLRFCPSCGGRLPEAEAVKYCTFCGENLAKYAAEEAGDVKPQTELLVSRAVEPTEIIVKTFADVMYHYDRFLVGLKLEGLEEEEIRLRAADFFAKLKEQLPARPGGMLSSKLKSYKEAAGYFSVVLKSIGDKDRLTRRLSEVLRRGLTATRIAVDMVPCVIVYKAKENDMKAAVAIFKEEQLHYAIIQGDFETDLPVDKIIPGFNALNREQQLMLRNVPPALWLGEQVRLVLPEVEWEGEHGVLAATDRAIYIFSGSKGKWHIVPYSRLTDAISHDDQGGALELINKAYSREEWLQISNEEQLKALYEHVRGALALQGRFD